LQKVFVDKMEDAIDQESEVKHSDLAQEVEKVLEEPSLINIKVPKEHVESCYFPTILSGGDYDLKLGVGSNDKTMKYDIIITSFGARYKGYCCTVSRTFFIDAPKKVESTYSSLLKIFDLVVDNLQHKKVLSEIYKYVRAYVSKKFPDLEQHLTKTLGFSTGIQIRDTTYQISAKSQATIKKGMAFVVSVGFQNVPLSSDDKKGGAGDVLKLDTFSVQVADTVVVTSEGCENLVKFTKDYERVSYFISETDSDKDESEDDEEEEKEDEDKPAALRGMSVGGILPTRTRVKKDNQDAERQAEREKKQSKLMEKKNAERVKALERRGKGLDDDDMEELEAKDLELYKKSSEYPSDVSATRIKVDMDRESVIVPVSGQPVAFHVGTIKNVVLPDPDAASYLRLNFYTPGQTVGKDVSDQVAKLIAKHGDERVFIKELTFRSLESANLNHCYRLITELRKRSKQREADAKNKSMLVKQASLIRMKDQRVPRLMDLTIRPHLSGRKTTGTLEAHVNGLRFSSGRGEYLDILYSNIKHPIFAPCKGETMIVIHLHLKDHLMIGKKRHKDVQFYTEAIESSVNLDGNRRSHYDPDEMVEEQRELELRKKLNHAFKDFTKKIEKVAAANGNPLDFQIPYHELGWYGTPNREMVYVQPTANCLVNVVDSPFFVVDLDTIEHIHFERVQFASKNFDMVIINKDFDKQPQRIDMIESRYLDHIQEWLTDMGFTYTSGPANLQWKAILQTVKDEGKFFYLDHDENEDNKPAGWAFLRVDDASDEEEEEEEESEFEAEDDDEDEDDDESEEEDDDSEEFVDEDEESDFDEEEELSEEGEDWDELEKKAAKEDRSRKRDWEMDEEELASRRGKKRGRR